MKIIKEGNPNYCTTITCNCKTVFEVYKEDLSLLPFGKRYRLCVNSLGQKYDKLVDNMQMGVTCPICKKKHMLWEGFISDKIEEEYALFKLKEDIL